MITSSTPTELMHALQAGDKTAFDALADLYQRELLVHCYRMMGSLHDAEDLVQETLVRAWEKRATFTLPGSFRAWLYRIATNLCLNALNRVPKRSLPLSAGQKGDPTLPFPQRQQEPIWLEPFPDDLLADQQIDPEYCALQREHTTLAFLVALHQLTPAQRAVLLLREVLDWPASEVAEWLHLSIPAVNSALQRARRALREHRMLSETTFTPSSPQLQALLDRYMKTWEQSDVPGLVALLREDAWFTMPPAPIWFQGRMAIAAFFQTMVFTASEIWHLYPTSANGNPAFGLYLRNIDTGIHQLFGLLALCIEGEQIAGMVAFLDLNSLTTFSLPPSSPICPIPSISTLT